MAHAQLSGLAKVLLTVDVDVDGTFEDGGLLCPSPPKLTRMVPLSATRIFFAEPECTASDILSASHMCEASFRLTRTFGTS
jgi:hypothetical protein